MSTQLALRGGNHWDVPVIFTTDFHLLFFYRKYLHVLWHIQFKQYREPSYILICCTHDFNFHKYIFSNITISCFGGTKATGYLATYHLYLGFSWWQYSIRNSSLHWKTCTFLNWIWAICPRKSLHFGLRGFVQRQISILVKIYWCCLIPSERVNWFMQRSS